MVNSTLGLVTGLTARCMDSVSISLKHMTPKQVSVCITKKATIINRVWGALDKLVFGDMEN